MNWVNIIRAVIAVEASVSLEPGLELLKYFLEALHSLELLQHHDKEIYGFKLYEIHSLIEVKVNTYNAILQVGCIPVLDL